MGLQSPHARHVLRRGSTLCVVGGLANPLSQVLGPITARLPISLERVTGDREGFRGHLCSPPHSSHLALDRHLTCGCDANLGNVGTLVPAWVLVLPGILWMMTVWVTGTAAQFIR